MDAFTMIKFHEFCSRVNLHFFFILKKSIEIFFRFSCIAVKLDRFFPFIDHSAELILIDLFVFLHSQQNRRLVTIHQEDELRWKPMQVKWPHRIYWFMMLIRRTRAFIFALQPAVDAPASKFTYFCTVKSSKYLLFIVKFIICHANAK